MCCRIYIYTAARSAQRDTLEREILKSASSWSPFWEMRSVPVASAAAAATPQRRVKRDTRVERERCWRGYTILYYTTREQARECVCVLYWQAWLWGAEERLVRLARDLEGEPFSLSCFLSSFLRSFSLSLYVSIMLYSTLLLQRRRYQLMKCAFIYIYRYIYSGA